AVRRLAVVWGWGGGGVRGGGPYFRGGMTVGAGGAGPGGPAPFFRPPPPAMLVLAGIVSVQLGAGLAARLFAELGPAGVAGLRLWWSAIIVAVAGGRPAGRVVRAVVAERAWRGLAGVLTLCVVLGLRNFSLFQSFAPLPLG